ncbi:Carboxypeptidase, partial [Aspergillus sclerotialis]
ASGTCPLAPKVTPSTADGLRPALKFIQDPVHHAKQVERLSRAVQVPTTVTDFMTDPWDDGFEVFVKFQEELEDMFPRVHKTTPPEKINRLGLLYTLPGKNKDLKPILFMAHQDVVPIADASDWTHPPFSGYYNATDGFLWGRGASDCKNVLIALLSVLEDLLEQDFQPERTILFSFGFDEESHGFLGAGSLAPFIEERYGKDAVKFILDEGGMGLQTFGDDVIYALPGVSEKGSLDLVLTLSVPGGHSSIPPPHTGIGIMSEIIYALEREELFSPLLSDDHPTRKNLECQAKHSPEYVEKWLPEALADKNQEQAAEVIAVSRGDAMRYILQTSQAADMINGGVKTNALPESVQAIVNYRVAVHQSPEEIFSRAQRIISRIAKSHHLSFSTSLHPLNASDSPQNQIQNHISMAPLVAPLSPAPISSTSLASSTWARFAGLARTVFESVFDDKTVVVAGDIMTGNTDTRFYWNLSRNIYRWSPTVRGGAVNIHTADERVNIGDHLRGCMLYYDLIRGFNNEDGY